MYEIYFLFGMLFNNKTHLLPISIWITSLYFNIYVLFGDVKISRIIVPIVLEISYWGRFNP